MNLAAPHHKFIHPFKVSDMLKVASGQQQNSLSSKVFKDVCQCFNEYR